MALSAPRHDGGNGPNHDLGTRSFTFEAHSAAETRATTTTHEALAFHHCHCQSSGALEPLASTLTIARNISRTRAILL